MNQYQLNKEIENFIDNHDSQGKAYSLADIEFIQQYEGYGGLANKGAKERGLLDEYFTPIYIAEYMYKLAIKYGYDGGAVLEPAIATGNIINPLPKKTKITAFEINHYSKRVCELRFPRIKVYEQYFETAFLQTPRFVSKITNKKLTWLEDYPFSLVIGNPPYGGHKSRYSSYFTGIDKFKQLEIFFMYKSMQLLKKGGLLIFITSSGFMRNGISYNHEKQRIAKIADFVDAYRLPKVFRSTDVPTDILIFRKK